MDESAFASKGREDRQTAGRAEGIQPPSAPTPLETKPTNPNNGRLRRILPWVIAALAVLVAAIAIGAVVVNQSSQPQSVAQLAPQPGSEGTIPVDAEAASRFQSTGVMQDDFVSHGSYGALEVWSATTEETRCLALAAEGRVSVYHCTPPTIDTIADFNIDPNLVPLSPSGEPNGDIRFILHDGVVDVYLSPEREAEYY